MKKQKTKKLLNGEHQILSIKNVLDQILNEATLLNPEIKEAIVAARDKCWHAFVTQQEKTMPK